MGKSKLLLRFFQFTFIVAVLWGVFVVGHFPYDKTQGSLTFGQWLVVLFAVYSAVGGFWGQRLMVRSQKQPSRSAMLSTSLGRWWFGHLVRLSGAEAVCFSSLVLHMIGGPVWLVDVTFGIGMVLLLIWRPGAIPV